MTDQERIERLEQMVRSLAESLSRVHRVVNTGNYEYTIEDINHELRDVKEFEREPPAPVSIDRVYTPKLGQMKTAKTACISDWHSQTHAEATDNEPWCGVCGRSVR